MWCVEYANNAGSALGTRSVTDDSDVILLFVHYITLDTVSEAVVAPLDDPMVDGAAIFATDNGRHELHRHPDSCIYKCVVMIGYRNRYTTKPPTHPMYAHMTQ